MHGCSFFSLSFSLSVLSELIVQSFVDSSFKREWIIVKWSPSVSNNASWRTDVQRASKRVRMKNAERERERKRIVIFLCDLLSRFSEHAVFPPSFSPSLSLYFILLFSVFDDSRFIRFERLARDNATRYCAFTVRDSRDVNYLSSCIR